MKMKKERTEQLIEIAESRIKELEKDLENCRDEIEIWRCAKAYLEFLLHGFSPNPSKRIQKEEDE